MHMALAEPVLLETADGLRAFEQLLAVGTSGIAVLAGDPARLDHVFHRVAPPAPASPALPANTVVPAPGERFVFQRRLIVAPRQKRIERRTVRKPGRA